MKEPNNFHNMKLRKLVVKPVTRQNISSCSSTGWKNWTTLNRFWGASCSQL